MASERTPGNVQDCQWRVSGASLEIYGFSLRRITEAESQLLGKETLWTASKTSGDWSWKRRLLMWREIQTARNCILDDVWSFTWWNDSRNWAEPKHGVNVEAPQNGAQVLVWAGSIFTFCGGEIFVRSTVLGFVDGSISILSISNMEICDFLKQKFQCFSTMTIAWLANKSGRWFNSWPFYPRSLEVTYKPYKPLSLGHKKPSQKGHKFFITWWWPG